jgi:hypothetical protein
MSSRLVTWSLKYVVKSVLFHSPTGGIQIIPLSKLCDIGQHLAGVQETVDTVRHWEVWRGQPWHFLSGEAMAKGLSSPTWLTVHSKEGSGSWGLWNLAGWSKWIWVSETVLLRDMMEVGPVPGVACREPGWLWPPASGQTHLSWALSSFSLHGGDSEEQATTLLGLLASWRDFGFMQVWFSAKFLLLE